MVAATGVSARSGPGEGAERERTTYCVAHPVHGTPQGIHRLPPGVYLGGIWWRMPSFPDDVQDDVQKRLRRLEGQVRGLQKMLDEGKDCREVVTQLSAAQSALDRIAYRLISAAMRHCVTEPDHTGGMTAEDLERLFLKIS